MRTIRACAILAGLALGVALPFALLGYGGHDFGFHVSSWIEVRDAWLAHTWPGWSEGANFTLGDPHSWFYPPISIDLGALLTLLLPLRMVPAAFVGLTVFVSGLSMYRASRSLVAPGDRLTAAALYMLSPYLVTTAVARFAVAELLVQAVLPLIVLALYEALWQRRARALLLLGILLGSAWLTNVPSGIVLFYSFAAAAAILAWNQRSFAPILRFVLAEAIAVSLAAFYLAPVWAEKRWIKAADLIRFEPRRGLLFMPQSTGSSSSINQACWIIAIAGILLVAASTISKSLSNSPAPAKRVWVYLAAISFCFQFPLALPLWNHLPELSAVVYPFRFLMLLGVAVPLVLLAPGTRRTLRLPACILLAMLTAMPFVSLARLRIRARSNPALRQPGVDALSGQWAREGFAGVPEYVPAGALLPTAPLRLAPATASPGCIAALTSRGIATRTFTTDSQIPCSVRVATFFYPWWQATDESGGQLPVAADSEGVLLISVPPGQHTVHMTIHAHSKVRTLSMATSVATLLLILMLMPLALAVDTRSRATTASAT